MTKHFYLLYDGIENTSSSTSASWHTDYRDTAYIYIGGLPFELTEGDVVNVFSQFGEPVHVSLVRDKDTGKSKGFAFLKYEDQRSTDLAVDNLGGVTVLGRVLKVDHTRYKLADGELNSGSDAYPPRESNANGNDPCKSNKRNKVGSKMRDREQSLGKEEQERAALKNSHDDNDPMKGYPIQQKGEEIAIKLAMKYQKSEKLANSSPKHDRRRRR